MTRQQIFISLPLVAVTLLCLLAGIYLFARKRSAEPAPSDNVIKHSVDTPAEDVLQYWTADKMSGAKPAPMPQVNELERRKRQPRRH